MMNLGGRGAFGRPGSGGQNASRFFRSFALSLNDNSTGVDATGAPAGLGSQREFMCGFLIGFFVGVLAIFCIWDRSISHRQKMGILSGVIAQEVLEFMLRRQATSSSSSSSSSKR
jgi:hypothetical protein